ncbi:MAG TPA: cytochrome P450 [Candidatus Acidoferrales bacterium]|nr:cytochrome P450 [Candidatus Acidoferrales bacterium]
MAATSSVKVISMSKGTFPPGPKGIALFRPLYYFTHEPLDFIISTQRKYGDIARFRFLKFPVYFCNRPSLIEEILITQSAKFIKSADLREGGSVLGNGLLTSEGDFWRRQRKLAQPAFHRGRVMAYAKVVTRYGEQMLETWKDSESREIHGEMMQLTLKIAARTLFGADLEPETVRVIGESLAAAIQQFDARVKTGFLLPASWHTPGNIRSRNAVRRLDDILHRIIDQRREVPAEMDDLLSMLLSARDDSGAGMDAKQLRDEVMTLLLAGHETTATTLAWTFYLLAQNPAAEAQLLAELQAVIPGPMPVYEDLPKLRFTEAIIRESMRLYPPAWAQGRQAAEDCTIGGYDVPRNTTIYMSQWVVQRDPRYFAEPDQFQPERWSDALQKKLPRFAYFPFGGGPRVCIGASFAMMEATLLLAAIASRFRISLVPGQTIKLWPSITLRPRDGIKVVLSKR